jgi:hypothetical protein
LVGGFIQLGICKQAVHNIWRCNINLISTQETGKLPQWHWAKGVSPTFRQPQGNSYSLFIHRVIVSLLTMEKQG